jgi:phospholipase C
MPDPATRANALDHVVVVLFENRSLDNVLGRLYGPGDSKTFEGVIGKELYGARLRPEGSRRCRLRCRAAQMRR